MNYKTDNLLDVTAYTAKPLNFTNCKNEFTVKK